MIKPIKHLGQNFLTSRKIVEQIVCVADLKSDDVVLEAGPGKGILTEELVKKAGKVIAVEKDKRLADFLLQKFAGTKNLQIIHGDILKFSPSGYPLSTNGYKIVANIPYYITSRFLRQFLENDCQPSLMVLMVQKEVAERIMARNGKESILSISVKVYGKPKIIKKVPAKYFSPQPKVDSAIILIGKISKDFFAEKFVPLKTVGKGNLTGTKFFGSVEKSFFDLVRRGFSSKRKMLKNNLGCDEKILGFCKISEKARAEDLSLGDWGCLYKKLAK